ncbi:MAG TPA: hypothetical protein VI757_11750 [Bacteroidia bacterium]|nr:hypothetical protein [Bacteroidia bacterium]
MSGYKRKVHLKNEIIRSNARAAVRLQQVERFLPVAVKAAEMEGKIDLMMKIIKR